MVPFSSPSGRCCSVVYKPIIHLLFICAFSFYHYPATLPSILFPILLLLLTLSQFTVNPDPGAQDYPRAVIIKSSEPRLELTKAFHNPSLLNGTGTTLVIENLLFSPAANRCPTDSHHHALLIKTRASRWLIAFGVAGAIVVAGAVGCVVGYFAGNAELGVAAGAVVVVVLTFVQGCILFL